MTATYHSLERGNFFEDWTDGARLSRYHDWSGVASIQGFRGALLTARASVDARTVTSDADDLYIATNRTDPDGYDLAGITEFLLDNPTVALGGSAGTRAPNLVLYMDATGRDNIVLSFTARDLESGPQDAVQQIIVQYRIGDTGSWSNVPGGYIADASVGGATKETHLTVSLPEAAEGQAELQIRIMTVDAAGYDEWIGIDDISVTSARDPGYGGMPLEIYDIQGAGHTSSYEGKLVLTHGIVTAVERGGFWMQSAAGDGDAATSDAIFVRSGRSVQVGDGMSVRGIVLETVRGDGLTVTEIRAERSVVESHGNTLPDAVVIGKDGILPPTAIIDDDGLTVFDPQNDGIDFWESLEGMRVTLDTPQAVSNTNSSGETDIVVSHGEGSTGLSDRGALVISDGDWNPEIIQIDERLIDLPLLTVGDQLSSVTGILGYGYNHYELVATDAPVITHDAALTRETTELVGDAEHLTVASYDLVNLDPTDTRFGAVARDIVDNLRAPDVIAVQRIQDVDGQGAGDNLTGHVTAQKLIDAIYQRSGILYTYVEIAPSTLDSTAGQANGNVRNGYFYRADRVELVDGNVHLIDDPIYDGTRRPLVATWEFNGQQVTTINVHFTSREGSDALWGDEQSPYHAGTIMRTNQIAALNEYVQEFLSRDPDANLMVTGNFNGYLFENAQLQLTESGLMTNLALGLQAEERYSVIEDGLGQLVDNTVVSSGLDGRVDYDIVHINSEFAGLGRAGSHDPQVVSIALAAGRTLYGGNGKDTLIGGAGNDHIYGGNGVDWIEGRQGNDWLQGDRANDVLFGGAGHESFAFGPNNGTDTILDFDTGDDRLVLLDGITLRAVKMIDADGDGDLDAHLYFTKGTTAILLDVTSTDLVQIDHGSALGTAFVANTPLPDKGAVDFTPVLDLATGSEFHLL